MTRPNIAVYWKMLHIITAMTRHHRGLSIVINSQTNPNIPAPTLMVQLLWTAPKHPKEHTSNLYGVHWRMIGIMKAMTRPHRGISSVINIQRKWMEIMDMLVWTATTYHHYLDQLRTRLCWILIAILTIHQGLLSVLLQNRDNRFRIHIHSPDQPLWIILM